MSNQENMQVAVYLDLENIRYSMLNLHGMEPDFKLMLDKIRRYGRPSVMRAYADFSEHPETHRQLQIVGFDPINVPVRRIDQPNRAGAVERIKNAADMVLAIDAVIEASDAYSSGLLKTFYLVTGDSDYIKLVTQLRNKFGQRVVVCGVEGSMSRDLRAAADEEDVIDVPQVFPADDEDIKRAIVAMVHRGPSPLHFWSMRILDSWCQDERNAIPGTPRQRRDMLTQLVNEGVLLQRQIEFQGANATETYLNEQEAVERGYLAMTLPALGFPPDEPEEE